MKHTLFLLALVLSFSCSIQKRKYQKGYYVEWNKQKTSKDKIADQNKRSKKSTDLLSPTTEMQANSSDKSLKAEASPHSDKNFLKKRSSLILSINDSCDLIVFKDGTEIRAKVEEIGLQEIRYKRCESPRGPMYVSKKSDVFMIKFANGNKELIQSLPEPAQTNTVNIVPLNSNKKSSLKTHPASSLSFFLGILGIIMGFMLLVTLFLSVISGVTAVFSWPLLIWLLLGLLAAAVGIYAGSQINKNPDIYQGKGQANAAIMIGFIIAALAGYFYISYYLLH